ncbi:MAG: hypothetical protein GY865_02385 [candidate division Zixibacteria bacterium]|nr:hypothetical protein [candidate division Zixibacteria bacterium]
MRIFCIIFIGLSLLIGCTPGGPSGGSSSDGSFVTIDTVWTDPSCCGDAFDICNALVYGSPPDGGAWYAASINLGSYVAVGTPKHFTSGFLDETLSVKVDYFDDIDEGQYYLEVYPVENPADIGYAAKRNSIQDFEPVILDGYTVTQCSDCCTYMEDGRQRRHAVLQKQIGGLTGASAKIKARYGLPCAFHTDTSKISFNVTWVGVINDMYNPQGYISIWAQTGVGWECIPANHNGNSDIWHFIYTEVITGEFAPEQNRYYKDEQEEIYDDIYPPDDGIEWDYYCFLDTVEGKWSFSIGNWGLLSAYSTENWNYPGYLVQWASEIGEFYEDDMAGTISDPCILSELSIRLSEDQFNEISIDTTIDLVHSDDWNDWIIDVVDSSEIAIWDLYPQ